MGEEWPKCAEREVMEETGLEVSLLLQDLPASYLFFSSIRVSLDCFRGAL